MSMSSAGSKQATSVCVENGGTIADLISLLRSAFQPKDFDKVQQMLIAREESMKRQLSEMAAEIGHWKAGYESMEKKHGELALRNLEIEDELNRSRRECEHLKEKMTCLNEDHRVLSDRARRYEERYSKLWDDFAEVENDKRELILKLKLSATDLECCSAARRSAEGEVEIWKKKLGEMEFRVLRLEEDTAKLVSGEGEPLFVQTDKMDENLGGGADEPISDHNQMEKKTESSGNGKPLNGICVSNHPRTEEGKPTNCLENNHTLSDHDCPATENVICPQESGSCSISKDPGSERPIRKQLVFKEDSSTKRTGLSIQGNERLESRGIIEINDSDDEKDANYSHTHEDVWRSCKSVQKRKRFSFSRTCGDEKDDGDDDENISVVRRKSKQVSGLIGDCKSSPVTDFSATPDASNMGFANVVPSSKQTSVLIRQDEKNIGSEKISRIPLSKCLLQGTDSSDSEDSSSSVGDEECTDAYIDNILATFGEKSDKNVKTWASDGDMLSALQKDPELCMNAVCALYRQQNSSQKSAKDIFSPKKRGFNHFDSLRGTKVAKFLTDGDPQGKLRKSVSELQQYDPTALDYCKRLVSRYPEQLFEIYQNKEDPFFLPP